MIVHCYPFVSRKSNRTSAIFADRKQITDSCGMEQWVAQRRLGLSDSTPEVNKAAAADKERITLAELSSLYRREEEEERRKEEELRIRKKINRLSCKYFLKIVISYLVLFVFLWGQIQLALKKFNVKPFFKKLL
jgi:hypothetical protein